MRKRNIYITLFFASLFLGLIVLYSSSLIDFFGNENEVNQNSYLASGNPMVERKIDFINSSSSMIGKEILVSGIVKEGYKNKSDELVIYIKDENLPFEVCCTLKETNVQVTTPLKLGENMILKGRFTNLDENIFLENCIIIQRMEVVENE